MKSFSKLTLAQIERLAKLSEEAGEVVQVVGKILRRGFDRNHPRKQGPTNRERLESELGDVVAAIEMLVDAGDVSKGKIDDAYREKVKSVKKWLYYN